MRIPRCRAGALALALLVSCGALAAERTATLHEITAQGEAGAVGTITFTDTAHGLLVTPDLQGLASEGAHGMHIHARGGCGPRAGSHGHAIAGGAAGGHYDPDDTRRHEGPYGEGHLGDLPNLIVAADGAATIPVLAPRPTVADLDGRAVMVHGAADHYDGHDDHDHGKGGVRMYCGVIE